MPAAQQLNVLALRKELLRARIAARRAQCIAAVRQVAPALSLVEQAATIWRSIPNRSDGLGVPAAILLFRKFGQHIGGLDGLLKYARRSESGPTSPSSQ